VKISYLTEKFVVQKWVCPIKNGVLVVFFHFDFIGRVTLFLAALSARATNTRAAIFFFFFIYFQITNILFKKQKYAEIAIVSNDLLEKSEDISQRERKNN